MSVHSNSSFVGPSWRPVDQTRTGLSCTPGSLLLAEVVTLRPAENSTTRDTWRLMADPGKYIYSYCSGVDEIFCRRWPHLNEIFCFFVHHSFEPCAACHLRSIVRIAPAVCCVAGEGTGGAARAAPRRQFQ